MVTEREYELAKTIRDIYNTYNVPVVVPNQDLWDCFETTLSSSSRMFSLSARQLFNAMRAIREFEADGQ